jgi:hypothetical protein
MIGLQTEDKMLSDLELSGRHLTTPQLHQTPVDSRPQDTKSSSKVELQLIGDQLIGINYYIF